MRFTKEGNKKVVVATNSATIAVLETAGWVGERDEPIKSDTPDGTWKVAELKAYADENSIDLLDASKKADILDAIELHKLDSADGAGMTVDPNEAE